MKKTAIILFILSFSLNANAQFLKKLQKHAERKIEREAERRSERRVDKQIDKQFDDAEDMIDGKDKKKKERKQDNAQSNKGEVEINDKSSTSKKSIKEKKESKLVWSSFDFVPGDTVLFEDEPSADEENGEFPSRWDLFKGRAEIAEVDGINVIIFPNGGAIVPYLKDSNKDYLPEVFTIEFDAYFQLKYLHRVFLDFYDKKNQNRLQKYSRVYLHHNSIEVLKSQGKYSKNLPKGGWRHFSIAVTKDKLKIYLNDERLINIPHMGINPTGITIEMDGFAADKTHQFIKNIRIAKGGVKYYKRVLSEGKIIVNGIKFDVNKATLKPESMGPINRIYKMMIKNTDLNFSVEGHTDSDGNDAFNMELSKARGKTVMDKLIAMGINKSRLKYTGYGESKPIDNNATPEGKANNRRVEFIKF